MKISEQQIVVRSDLLSEFTEDVFNKEDRSIVVVGGAGFDSRATYLADKMAGCRKSKMSALLFREERPNPESLLKEAADKHQELLEKGYRSTRVESVQIFADDNAPVGGRRAIDLLRAVDFSGVTDVILDISALSLGIYFPCAKFLWELSEGDRGFNFYIFVAESPILDACLDRESHDQATYIHGFRVDAESRNSSADAACLWIPQIVGTNTMPLGRLHDLVQPTDVCPVVPFPSDDPSDSDRLLWSNHKILQEWSVDWRNIIYAAERDPLDLYRTILMMEKSRRRVFRDLGGSRVSISPAESKALSIGSFLAARERNLSVAVTETISFHINEQPSNVQECIRPLMLWLNKVARESHVAK